MLHSSQKPFTIASSKKYYHFWQGLIIIILSLGLFFRCANLDKKVYWVDEVATSLRVAGYTKQEAIIELSKREIITIADLQKYQKIDDRRNLSFTIAALQKSPEHAPLYFLITRFWLEMFGSSILAIRSLSVIFSLLAIVALYYLCRELFNCHFAGEIAISLMAVSPFFVAYAQEARPYSFWTLTIVLSSIFLLRSLKTNHKLDWVIYTVSLSLSLYTSILSLFVAIAQVIYSIIIVDRRKNNILKNFSIAFTLAIVSFIPWLLVILSNWQKLADNTSWMREAISLPVMVVIGIYNTFVIFIESPIYLPPDLLTIVRMAIDFSFFILIILSAYFLIAKTSSKIWLFVLSLGIIPRLTTIAIDLITGGQTSTAPRYLIPFYLSLQLLLAYVLSRGMFDRHNWHNWRKWQIVFVGIISIGITSCSFNIDSSPRYQKTRNFFNPELSKIVDLETAPLIISETKNTLDLISLSYTLPLDTKLKLIDDRADISEYFNNYTSLLLFNPSASLLQKIRSRKSDRLQEIYQPKLLNSLEIYLSLWKIDNSIDN
jgi:uncharacterized membrane protein